MTQFKDKSRKVNPKNTEAAAVGHGLLSYPVLQAADILLYKATAVPVGEDQIQHLNLTRDIARWFNNRYRVALFPEPQVIPGEVMRVMSLRDGSKKMSKSDDSDASRINLTDSADVIVKKIMKATTDSIPNINFDPLNRPHLANLLRILSALTGRSVEDLCDSIASHKQLKETIAAALIERLSPMQTEYKRLMDDPLYLHQVLRSGADQAREIAAKTMLDVRRIVGFVNGSGS